MEVVYVALFVLVLGAVGGVVGGWMGWRAGRLSRFDWRWPER